uniref:F-box/LRR-repeat protein 12-like n=1 Tax=Erigeron canadensis TaxID=72917 RepID=UPI001CB8CFFC|nr:F-box/LRR-repeat protein 12-like [Erigeron canadensis]
MDYCYYGKQQGPHKRRRGICMINLLSDDCLFLVFEKLDSKADRDSFGLTCHRYLDIQNSSRKCLRTSNKCISSSMIAKLLDRFTQLQSLTVSTRCPDFSNSIITKLPIHGSRLHSLDLSNSLNVSRFDLSYCSIINDAVVASVASSCPSLSTIRLRHSCVTDEGIKYLATKLGRSLKRVDILGCSQITDLGISHLNRNCRQLTVLRITGCSKIVGASILGLPPTLVALHAKECAFDATLVSGALVRSGGCSLEYLDVSYPWYKHELASLAFGFPATLKVLNLQCCNLVMDADIINISKGCPLLQEWNLTGCGRITFLGWKSIASHCQNLETLHVNYCQGLRDESLLDLGKGCSRLTLIYLATRYIGIRGFRSFKKQRPDVKIIQSWPSIPVRTSSRYI